MAEILRERRTVDRVTHDDRGRRIAVCLQMSVSYDATLVLLSILVAIIGSYTGLLLMARRGAFAGASYKLRIVAAAAAIGSSIWSMHFIAMLALGLPMPVEYESLSTTISAFIAIMLTGLGLYAASSGHVTRYAVPAGGLLMGGGIAGMHYTGMSAVRAACVVSYDPMGVAASVLVGMAVATLALWFTLRERGAWETALGAVALGLAISSMHYVAMMATRFIATGDVAVSEPAALTQHNLAFIVAIMTFLICGLFLVQALPDKKSGEQESADVALSPMLGQEPAQPSSAANPQSARIALRRNQSVFYAEPGAIVAVHADGHYSKVLMQSEGGELDEYFCETAISGLAKLLTAPQFVRVHRSHIVNMRHALGFRRQGDAGLLLIGPQGKVAVPVSRSNMRQVLRLLEDGAADPPISQPMTA
jgi:NO-binding membrane sensor protein with MHYT domain